MLATATLFLALTAAGVGAQDNFAHEYPGMPKGGYTTDWQQYFQVMKPLPNVTFDLGQNWAGNVAVDRVGHPNNTLFFWAFEKENGSLTAKADERTKEPWGIWLNGGPGSSSMLGLLTENGPLQLAYKQLAYNQSAVKNNYSWDKLADYFWLDQPVGTGFATVSPGGRIRDMDDMAMDFWGFVSNLVKIFPSLASRPLYLTGESYAGTYIPYITKAYVSLAKPPTKLAKIAIGNGAMGHIAEYEDANTVSLIETHPELINFNVAAYEEFVTKSHLCGYDLNLTYPQTGGHFPVLKNGFEDAAFADIESRRETIGRFQSLVKHISATMAQAQSPRKSFPPASHALDRRALQTRSDVTLDPYFKCAILSELWLYAVNFTAPWNTGAGLNIDVYDVPNALSPQAQGNLTIWLNDPQTIEALHAPTTKMWQQNNGATVFENATADPSLRPIAFFDDLAENASAHHIQVVIYSGNDDSLIPHWGSEVAIQNTTFGGIQGFTRKPSTEWTTDDGKSAGIIHQERNWTYVLVYGAGHLVPREKPEAAYVLLREFILGDNQTGLVIDSSDNPIGPDHADLVIGAGGDILRADPVVYTGAGTTQGSIVAPSATVAAWDQFMATRWASTRPTSSVAQISDAFSVRMPWGMLTWVLVLCVGWIS